MDHTQLRTPAGDPIPNRAYGFQASPLGDRRANDQIPDFFVQGAGGVYSTVGDLARWQHALNTGRVISPALYARATTPVIFPDGTKSPEGLGRSEEHTSELQSLMRNSYAVFCLKKKIQTQKRSI